MEDTVEDDDKWLYGGSEATGDTPQDNNQTDRADNTQTDDLSQIFDNQSSDDFRQLFDEPNASQDPTNQSENHIKEEERDFGFEATDKELTSEANHNNEEEEDSDEEDDDDVQVTIGDIKANTFNQYNSTPMNLNITKRTANFVAGQTSTATKQKGGLDIDAVGTYNGVPIYDVNLDSLEEKPWRKPGADITDYFNYGFNEDMWKLYCERQKKLRSHDFLSNGPPQASKANPSFSGTPPVAVVAGKPGAEQTIPIASVNENSKYTGIGLTKKAGPPPGRKQSGTIDVIGGGTPTTPSMLPSRRPPDTKENFIQVIGNRPPGPPPPGMPPGMPFPPPPGLSMPPPFGFPPPGVEIPPGMPPPPGMAFIPGPNGQPIPFPPGDFPRMPFPHPGMMPHPEHHFDEQGEGFHEGMRGSSNDGRDDDRDRDRDRERDRDYHRSGRGFSREYRDDDSYRRGHYREREYEHHERSRDREDHETRRHRERDTKEKEREVKPERDRERERERDRERDRDRESRDSSSRRRHREEEEDSSRSSTRHKHSKRSKREKEEEEKESKH